MRAFVPKITDLKKVAQGNLFFRASHPFLTRLDALARIQAGVGEELQQKYAHIIAGGKSINTVRRIEIALRSQKLTSKEAIAELETALRSPKLEKAIVETALARVFAVDGI